jgi:hypothetical protein
MFSPIPIYKTPLFLRIFGYKKWRYRLHDQWIYAKDIHEVAEQLRLLDEFDDFL